MEKKKKHFRKGASDDRGEDVVYTIYIGHGTFSSRIRTQRDIYTQQHIINNICYLR